MNDTGNDASPYNPISSCALDPVYLHLPDLKGRWSERREIKDRKFDLLRDQFKEQAPDFLQDNPWLAPYGQYLGDPSFHAYVQQRCFTQLQQVKKYADQQGIFLKGDLPHLMSAESVDVQTFPHLFRKDFVAGAPPDNFTPLGQKWGFPLYDWNAMRKEQFLWWKTRFDAIASLYHIYRLDHVIGFFRIWGIPPHASATEGHFIPEDPSLWEPLGREILEMMIKASSLLPMAEDLGKVFPVVTETLRELGICGVKVPRWQKEIPFSQYEPFSMTTVSTPDMEPLQCFDPYLTVEQRRTFLQQAHSSSSYFHINLLQEYLALFPELRWPDPHQDQINIPGVETVVMLKGSY